MRRGRLRGRVERRIRRIHDFGLFFWVDGWVGLGFG
jgi:hypothetical protein